MTPEGDQEIAPPTEMMSSFPISDDAVAFNTTDSKAGPGWCFRDIEDSTITTLSPAHSRERSHLFSINGLDEGVSRTHGRSCSKR